MEFIFIILSWLILLVPGFDDSVPPTGNQTFKIEYSDNVESINTISDEPLGFWGFEIELKQNSDPVLDIRIPKTLPTPASFTGMWNYGNKPLVLADGEQMDYEILEEPCYFHYKILIEDNRKNVEISYTVIATGTWKLYSPTEFSKNDPCYNKVIETNPVSEKKMPLKLDDFASELWYDHELIIDGTILDISGYGGEQRKYDIRINEYFKPSEGKDFGVITVYGFTPFDSSKGDRGIFFIKKENAQWKHGQYGAKATEKCTPELMYHSPTLIDPPLYRGGGYGPDFTYVDCMPYYYKKYLPQYMKAHGATEFPSPHTQSIYQVPAHEIVCNGNLILVIKHNGSPACVKPETKAKLIERGWSNYNPNISEAQQQSIKNLVIQNSHVQELLSKMDWDVRAIRSGVSFGNDCPFGSCYSILIDQKERNETLVVIVNLDSKKVVDVKTTPGWNDTLTLEPRKIESEPANNPKESFQEKYDAVVEGTIIGCMGHKETYPIRYQCEVQVDSYIKFNGEKTGQLTVIAYRDKLDENNQKAIFGLDYHEEKNYYEVIETGFTRK